jgi:hypothetical protein
MMADAIKPTRAEAVRQERRRKPGTMVANGIKLALDESKLDRNAFAYRFVRDEGNRVAQLHAQDWDPITEPAKADSTGLGSVPTALGGTDETGRPYNMVALRKRKDWFEADQREKQKPLDEIESAIRRGNPNHTGNDLKGPGVYTPGSDQSNPGGVNNIERA